MLFLARHRTGGTIPVCHEQTLSLTAGDYINRIYLRDQVLGPFPGAVVGHELVAMLAGRYELSSYLRDIGGATLWNGLLGTVRFSP